MGKEVLIATIIASPASVFALRFTKRFGNRQAVNDASLFIMISINSLIGHRSRSRQVRLIFVLEWANLSQSDYQIV